MKKRLFLVKVFVENDILQEDYTVLAKNDIAARKLAVEQFKKNNDYDVEYCEVTKISNVDIG